MILSEYSQRTCNSVVKAIGNNNIISHGEMDLSQGYGFEFPKGRSVTILRYVESKIRSNTYNEILPSTYVTSTLRFAREDSEENSQHDYYLYGYGLDGRHYHNKDVVIDENDKQVVDAQGKILGFNKENKMKSIKKKDENSVLQ